MTTYSLDTPRAARAAGSDPAWTELYRVGGVSALVAMLGYIVATVLVFSMPAAPTSGGAATLEYIAEHRSIYILEQVLWLAPSVLLTVVFLAFYPALKSVNRSYAAIGSALGMLSWAVTLAYPATGGGAPALVPLSDGYAMATTDGQRLALGAAAEVLIAQNAVATAMGVLEAAGILIVSLVMLSSAFSRWVAYLGVTTGVVGVVCEALKPVVGLGYVAYGLLLFVWLGAIGWELLRLGHRVTQSPPSANEAAPPSVGTQRINGQVTRVNAR